MALIKTTAIVDEISGKIQGQVFAKNKGGLYVRGRGQVLNPKTNFQSGVRSIFATVTRRWSQISEDDRKSWNALAPDLPYRNRLGDMRELSGKALFQKLNQNLNLIGASGIDAAPDPGDVIGVKIIRTELEVDESAGTMDFAFDLVDDAGDTSYILEATPLQSPGTFNANNHYRTLGTAGSSGVGNNSTIGPSNFFTDSSELYDEYEKKFGTPVVGKKVFIRVRPVNAVTGQSSVTFQTSTIVV